MHRPSTGPPCPVIVITELDLVHSAILNCVYYRLDLQQTMRVPSLHISYSSIVQRRLSTFGFRRFPSTRSAVIRSAAAAQRKRLNSSFAAERSKEREDSVIFGKHASTSFAHGESCMAMGGSIARTQL